jgi:hypothetical protein
MKYTELCLDGNLNTNGDSSTEEQQYFKPLTGTTFHLGWETATVLQVERGGQDSKDTGHCNLQTSSANNFSSS